MKRKRRLEEEEQVKDEVVEEGRNKEENARKATK